MLKIIESTLVSADGVVASPPAWAMEYRDEEVDADALERFLPAPISPPAGSGRVGSWQMTGA